MTLALLIFALWAVFTGGMTAGFSLSVRSGRWRTALLIVLAVEAFGAACWSLIFLIGRQVRGF